MLSKIWICIESGLVIDKPIWQFDSIRRVLGVIQSSIDGVIVVTLVISMVTSCGCSGRGKGGFQRTGLVKVLLRRGCHNPGKHVSRDIVRLVPADQRTVTDWLQYDDVEVVLSCGVERIVTHWIVGKSNSHSHRVR